MGIKAYENEQPDIIIVEEYEQQFNIPTTDVLKHGCDKLITSILD